MKNFSKHLVLNDKQVDGWMYMAIGSSWDHLRDKYPLCYPAILIIGGESKQHEYVYESDFKKEEDLTIKL